MIVVSKTAGFCFGVKRAVEQVYKEVEKENKIATLGEIIHNPQVVGDLKEKGVYAYDEIDDIPPGVCVVIRTHGVGRDVIDKLKSKNFDIIDLTCPFVKKIHNIVEKNVL